MENKSLIESKKKMNKDFVNFIKTKKAKLLKEPLDYDPNEDTKENPFLKLKESKKVI